MPRLRGYFLSLILLLSCSMLAGCTSSFWDMGPPPDPAHTATLAGAAIGAAGGAVIGSTVGAAPLGAGIGAFWGMTLGHVIAESRSLIDYLKYNGVQVVEIGDQVLIILPTERFYYPNTANFNRNYTKVLLKVVELLRRFDKVTVKVGAYTSGAGSWRRNLSLSRLQAQRMLKFLWQHGMCARMAFAVGYGQAMPIASNHTRKGERDNNRIEITLTQWVHKPL